MNATAIQAMVVVGGAAALSWEVIWQLQATLAFGISALGTALTLAATMGGMTTGSLVAGRLLSRRAVTRPLRLYGICELAIGVAGVLVLPAFRGLEALDARIHASSPDLAPVLHLIGVAAVLAPASIAMGATVPVFVLVARRALSSVSRLYAANTAGGALGVIAISFAILPSLGVLRSVLLLALLNTGIFVASLWLDRSEASPTTPAAAPAAAQRPGFGIALVVVLCTGFATFGLEVAWFRALRAAFWSTSSTFAIMLASVLVPLAAGAHLVPWLRRRGVTPGTLLAAAAAAILLATPAVERIDLFVARSGNHPAALFGWLFVTLVSIGPAVLCLATALPWTLEEHAAPGRVGWLYATNTCGAVVGSMLATFVLLPGLGFARSTWVLGLGIGALAVFVGRGGLRRGAMAFATLAALALSWSLEATPGLDRPLHTTDFAGTRVLAHEEGPDSTVSVIEDAGGLRSLMIDGFAATTENPVAAHYMAWMGRLPAMLHPNPRRGLVICFGTGQTANALRREGVAKLDVVDVSAAVFELAPYFASNEAVLEDPRVRSIVMDGRAWLRRTQDRYDVITLEPMPPNFAGVNSLYSREFYRILRSRLDPGGVTAQWLPIHLLTPAHAASIVRAFVDVFPDAVLWFDPSGVTGILLGRNHGGPQRLGASWPGLSRDAPGRTLDAEQVRRSLLLRRAGLLRFAGEAEPVTDDNQLLQFSRVRAGLRGERMQRLLPENLRLLSQAAGRRPYLLGHDERGKGGKPPQDAPPSD